MVDSFMVIYITKISIVLIQTDMPFERTVLMQNSPKLLTDRRNGLW